jgi:hypothetical protein
MTTVATKESTARDDKPTAEDKFEDNNDDCHKEESTARDDKPSEEAVFEDDKDDFIEFFFALVGSSLTKTKVLVE